jgi:hypothetical protein
MGTWVVGKSRGEVHTQNMMKKAYRCHLEAALRLLAREWLRRSVVIEVQLSCRGATLGSSFTPLASVGAWPRLGNISTPLQNQTARHAM